MRTYSSSSKSDETQHRVVLVHPSMDTYGQQPHPPPQPNTLSYHHGHEPRKSCSFGRTMLILLVVLVVAMCLASLIMFFIFGTHMPVFQAESLKVSNFSATNTFVQGLWETEISVKNANKKLTIKFDRLRSMILYKGIILGVSDIQKAEVEEKQTLNLTFSVVSDDSKNYIDSDTKGWGLPPLASDWKDGDGKMDFSVRLFMNVNFSSSDMVYKNDDMMVFCDDMSLKFSSMSEAASKRGSASRCMIHY